MVISLSAKGLTHGEISAHLAEVYGADVSKQTITAITGRVIVSLIGGDVSDALGALGGLVPGQVLFLWLVGGERAEESADG